MAWLLRVVGTGRSDSTRCLVTPFRSSVDVRRRGWCGLARCLPCYLGPRRSQWVRSGVALGLAVGLLALGAGWTIAPLGPPTRERTLA